MGAQRPADDVGQRTDDGIPGDNGVEDRAERRRRQRCRLRIPLSRFDTATTFPLSPPRSCRVALQIVIYSGSIFLQPGLPQGVRKSGMLAGVLITTGIAVGTAVVQTIMRGMSRTDVSGKRHNLTKEDGLFWTDWCIAGTLAFVLANIAAANAGTALTVSEVGWTYGVIVASFAIIPYSLRILAYAPDAKLKDLPPAGLGWVIATNILGLIILTVAVFSGLNVYEWQ